MKKLLQFKFFMLLIIVLTMYNNLEHSANIYYHLIQHNGYGPFYNHIQAYLVVIVIDLSVIAFIVRAKNTESKVFAWLLFLINMLFFDVSGTTYKLLTHPDTSHKLELLNELTGQLVFSGIFSFTIHRFSKLYYNEYSQKGFLEHSLTVNKQLKSDLDGCNKTIEGLKSEIIASNEIIDKLRNTATNNNITTQQISDELAKYKAALTCEKCNAYVGETIPQLHGHRARCNTNK